MKVEIRKMLRWLLAGTMVITMLTGCGGNENTATNNESGTVKDTAEEKEEQSGKIVVSVVTSQAETAGWGALEKAYEDAHPGVDVVVDLKAEDGYIEWLNNIFNNNTDVNVDIVNINYAADASKGKRINFNDYLDIKSPYSEGTWKEQFKYEIQNNNKVTGELYELSLSTVQVMWLYNQEIFEKVGVTPPETWDDLIEVCEKIQAAGYQPIAMAGDNTSFDYEGMGWQAQIYSDQTTRSMINTVRAQEGDYCFDPDIDGKFVYDPSDPWNDDTVNVTPNPVRFYKAAMAGEISVDNPGMRTVWSNFAKVYPKYAGGDAMFGTNTAGAQNLFYQGKAAMYLSGGWEIVTYMNYMKELEESGIITDSEGNKIEGTVFTMGSFTMPSMEGEGIEAPARSIEVPHGFIGAVSKNIEQDELVMDFIMFYSSAEGQSVYLDAFLANGGSVSGPSLVYGVKYPEEIEKAFANTKFIGNCQKGFCNILASSGKAKDGVRRYYSNALAYLSGQNTLEQFIAAQKELQMDGWPVGMESDGISMTDLNNPAAEPTGED